VLGFVLGFLYSFAALFFALGEKTGYLLFDLAPYFEMRKDANFWNAQLHLCLVALLFGWLIFKYAHKSLNASLLGFSASAGLSLLSMGYWDNIGLLVIDVSMVLGFSLLLNSINKLRENRNITSH
tara:strand:+ start:884 stop:1258 length:375 start_codon:yes stop_codon:yes gene_type:complete